MNENVNVEIAPGAALADPNLQGVVRERLQRVEQRQGLTAWWGNRLERPDVFALQHLLAKFPWREYQYKYGRWQPVERWWDPHGVFPMKWGRTYDTFQLLDPDSGQPVGELRARGKLPPHSGRLWFAGDPRVAGVYTPAGDGTRELWVVTSRFVNEKQAREATATMQPSEIPAIDPGPYRERMRDEEWPWAVDQPAKPTK